MPVQNSVGLIAYCGLYCGACGKYVKELCPGCIDNKKTSLCAVKNCCINKKIASCAECADFIDKSACLKLNGPVSKIIYFFTDSDRLKCLKMLSELGPKPYAGFMSENGFHSLNKN